MTLNPNRVQSYFDQLEITLDSEAELVGLFEHNTMIGSAREFLIKRVLRSILPPIVHIGSGKIIDSQGNSSNQVDIILYDSRFPVLEVESGVGLYFLSGVIGAIEVKSTLTESHLYKALENAISVLKLSIEFFGKDRFKDRVMEFTTKFHIDNEEAARRALYEIVPVFYVFAFNSPFRKKALSFRVEKWFTDNGQPAIFDNRCALLPRIIVAGQTIGILDDGYYQIDPGEDIKQKWSELYGPKAIELMSFWDAKYRFGILVSHILGTTTNRLGLAHHASSIQFSIEQYLPVMDYFNSHMKGKGAWHICWKENT